MAVTKSVKVVTDLVTQKQVIKQDLEGNVLFKISGTLPTGFVSSSLPISGSDIYLSGKIYPGINVLADVSASLPFEGQFLKFSSGKWIPSLVDSGSNTIITSGNLEGDGSPVSPVTLKDNINLTNLTASYLSIGGAIVNDPSSPTPFSITEVAPGVTDVIDSFTQNYSAAKYIVLAKTANHSQIAEVLVVKNNTTVMATPYAISYTTNSPLAVFDVQKNDTNSTIELIITNTHITSITITMQRSYLI